MSETGGRSFVWDFSVGGKVLLGTSASLPSARRKYDSSNRKGIPNHVTGAEKVEMIRAVARRGYGMLATARLCGVAPNTCSRYYPYDENILCQCGQSVHHKGWCGWRLMQSPERQAFLRRWAYRSSGLLVSVSDGRLVQAAAITLRPSNIAEEVVTHIDILNAVRKHAPMGLDSALREDLIQDIFLEVMEHRTPLSELGAAIKRRMKEINGEVSRFKFVSLDSIIPGTDDLRLIDTIASDRFHF